MTQTATETHIQHVTNLGYRATCYSTTAHDGGRKRWTGPWRITRRIAAGDLAAHERFDRDPLHAPAIDAGLVRYTAPDGSTYGRPFRDHEGRLVVDVAYPDAPDGTPGDRFVTYYVSADVRRFFGV